jgi:N-acetylglucosaminyldiphosphoundecaprenol N-acetyl-beta-D-mannosaminyltransferase
VRIGSVAFDPLTTAQAETLVRDGMARGSGGCVLVVGREALRRGLAPALQAAIAVLAGSTTAIWASWLAGQPLPPRVRPPELAESLCGACATDGRRVFVVGGAPGGPGIPSVAQRAAAVLGLKYRGLRIAGTASSPVPDAPLTWARLCADVVEAKPDLVLVGTEPASLQRIVEALRTDLPSGWLVGSPKMIDALLADATLGSGRRPRSRLPRSAVLQVASLLVLVVVARLSRRPRY